MWSKVTWVVWWIHMDSDKCLPLSTRGCYQKVHPCKPITPKNWPSLVPKTATCSNHAILVISVTVEMAMSKSSREWFGGCTIKPLSFSTPNYFFLFGRRSSCHKSCTLLPWKSIWSAKRSHLEAVQSEKQPDSTPRPSLRTNHTIPRWPGSNAVGPPSTLWTFVPYGAVWKHSNTRQVSKKKH